MRDERGDELGEEPPEPGCFEELLDEEEEEEEEVDFFEEEEGLVFRLEAPFPFDLDPPGLLEREDMLRQLYN